MSNYVFFLKNPVNQTVSEPLNSEAESSIVLPAGRIRKISRLTLRNQENA